GASLVLRKDRIVDVAGLTDYAIATHTGNNAALEDYLTGEGLPDVVDAHGPSGHIAHYQKLLQHYRRDGQFWVLNGLSPGVDPRCPQGHSEAALRQAIAALRPEEAIAQVRCLQAHANAMRAEVDDLTLLDRALEASAAAEAQGKSEAALRWSSLATLLSNEDAHLRRRTERLRLKFLANPIPEPGR
ncbi:MAG: hypothetical protein ACT4TC_22480, partial [Myxococcaceae bacterium]